MHNHNITDRFNKKIVKSVEAAKEKLEKVLKTDSLVFPLFTDLHTNDIGHDYTQRLLFALRCISDKIKCDAVINLGDNFDTIGRRDHITNSELKKRYEEIFSAIHDATKIPLVNVNGNHDGPGTEFFKPSFWNDITKGKYGNTSAVYDGDRCYYFIDFKPSDTRLVVLCTPSDSDTQSLMPSPIWNFGTRQLDWLKNVALDTSSDVIVLSHVPFFNKYTLGRTDAIKVWDGENEREAKVSAICGEADDAQKAAEILNDFNCLSGRGLVAVLSGHTHSDSLWLPFEKKGELANPLSCSQIVSARACNIAKDEEMLGVSIDLVVWTPQNRKLNLIRIGDGEDRCVTL